MTAIINLTPHPLQLYQENGEVLTISPTAPAARVSSVTEEVFKIGGFPITRTTFGDVENLPDPEEGTIFVVSMLVQQAAPNRTDLYRPDTGPQNVVRDGEGKIIGVRALAI
jgi:hypothetical protein